MSRPMFRSLLGAVAASLLIAAAGACSRENPNNPNHPSAGGTGGTGTGGGGTPSAGGTPTGTGGTPNGQIPGAPCKVDSDCTGGFVCNVAISRYATVRVTPLADATANAEFEVHREGDRALLRAVSRRYDVCGAHISLTNDFPVAAGLCG